MKKYRKLLGQITQIAIMLREDVEKNEMGLF